MTRPLWRGVGVALVTLFDDAGAVALDATARHAARLVGAGMGAVLVAGTTGEAETLTDEERVALVGAVRGACPAGVPVVAGASGEWAGAAVRRVEAVVAAGADAVLVAPPRRGSDLVGYFAAVAGAAGGVPVLAYHFPGVAGGEVPVDVLAGLPVAGVKDSSGSAERLLAQGRGVVGWTYAGSAALLGCAGWLGAAGALVAVGNAVPEDCVAAWEGDVAAQLRVAGVQVAARRGGPVAGLKELVARRYATSVAVRAV